MGLVKPTVDRVEMSAEGNLSLEARKSSEVGILSNTWHVLMVSF
jgi:hypothetical protein